MLWLSSRQFYRQPSIFGRSIAVSWADTAIYDAFGILDADVDGLNGGAYPGRDSVGYLGQSGHYTGRETISISPGGLLSVGGTYYDAKQGRFVTRGSNINGFKALDNNPASYVDWLDVTQITIDTVGLIPALNVPASVTSAGISAYKGDWAGAGMSLAAVIPFEGMGAEALKIARDAKGLTKEVSAAGRELSIETNTLPKRKVPYSRLARGLLMQQKEKLKVEKLVLP